MPHPPLGAAKLQTLTGVELAVAVERSLAPDRPDGPPVRYDRDADMFLALVHHLGSLWGAVFTFTRRGPTDWHCTIDGTCEGTLFHSEGTGGSLLLAGCRAIAEEYPE